MIETNFRIKRERHFPKGRHFNNILSMDEVLWIAG